MTHLGLIGITLALPSCGGRDEAEVAPPMEGTPMTIRLESSAFEEGADIPRRYTCDGEDISPPLSWSGVPDSARSLVLICDDPDAPRGTWTHWVLYDLPPGASGLPEGLPADEAVRFASGGSDHDARQGKNDFRKAGYGGPCPPSGTHRYFFRLYALDTTTGLGPGASRRPVEQAMQGHVLAQGQLMGRYTRGR
ncbi:YbhB/YbcL family Raf kinase inhibitor-like protein [Tautonia plasticadhaerens]|uniref:Putative kinase inhibitor protein n=1 Tax=Tautonia plasticadhaerens TaxID=2527974 RepID=A0A518H460_9BACT|nr:YbhB/YbcL family Raf kinase inhibitor-like protein [Tautonia plasticadhaerens]QDV35613.1 putative kinase inhibitor protein [Tautonia plasticadhaerens]